jgi:prolyl-tRNA synthetase
MQSAIEQSHDENGIIWPKAITPFDFHIAVLDPKHEGLMSYANALTDSLNEKGYTVLIDDRNERPGFKFKDADLLGLPVRITLGQKGFESDEVEVVTRYNNEKSTCDLDSALSFCIEKYKECK